MQNNLSICARASLQLELFCSNSLDCSSSSGKEAKQVGIWSRYRLSFETVCWKKVVTIFLHFGLQIDYKSIFYYEFKLFYLPTGDFMANLD